MKLEVLLVAIMGALVLVVASDLIQPDRPDWPGGGERASSPSFEQDIGEFDYSDHSNDSAANEN